MKKTLLLVFTILAVALSLTSCATSMSVTYKQPSNINMGSYRNLAVASTVMAQDREYVPMFIRSQIYDSSIKSYNMIPSTYSYSDLSYRVKDYTDAMISKALSQNGYYNLLNTAQTDTYLSLSRIGQNPSEKLKEAGYDAVLIPRITELVTDEWITADKYKQSDNTYKVRYYINRKLTISLTITVVDTATSAIIATKSYSDYEYDRDEFTPDRSVLFNRYGSYAERIIEWHFASDVLADFVPTTRVAHISLKANKPKLAYLEPAYKAAKSGNVEYALSLFMDAYQNQGHLASGYNAAVLLATQGDIEQALSILDDIRNRIDDKNINYLYSRLSELKRKNDEAEAQLQQPVSTETAAKTTTTNVYEYLLN